MVEDMQGGLHSCPEEWALLGLSKEHCCHPTQECATWDIFLISCSQASGGHPAWERGCSDGPVVDGWVEEGGFDVPEEDDGLRALVD